MEHSKRTVVEQVLCKVYCIPLIAFSHGKREMVRRLYDRAQSMTQQNESLKEEESHLMETFTGNGYPRAFGEKHH